MPIAGDTRWPFPPERKAVVGVVHLPPLPGAPGFQGDFGAVLKRAVADARALQRGGADGLIVENYGDAPFFPQQVGPETVAAMSVVARTIREETNLVLGINVLRNDAAAALAVAAVCQAQFIRVNVLAGARLTDQGVIQPAAAQLLRYRKHLGAEHVAIWADADVKHSAPLAPRPLEEEVDELVHRNGADCVILTGPGTGRAVDGEQLRRVAQVCPVPLVAGSGVTVERLAEVLPWVQAVIVGTAFHRQGELRQPLEEEAIRRLVQAVRRHG